MEYSNTNMSGGQQTYVSQSQEPPRVSGCNPQHLTNTFPGADCNSPNRNYGPYSQAYQTHEYSGPHTSHIAGPQGVYQQTYPGEVHAQSLTLNQLLQQNSSSGTYQVRAMNNTQPVYRSYDPYSYTYKSGAPSCVSQDRSQANTYSYSGAQRFSDPYTRSYLPYPPGPNYPYYPHSQPLVQRTRAPQPPNLEYPNVNSCNQSRPPQPTPPGGGGTSNQIERPPSRNINYINSSSHAAFQNTQISSPVYSSGSQMSSWSPHTATFGSPQHVQSQPRPRSLSRDYQPKINDGSSESSTTNNNSSTRPDSQNEGTSNTFEDTGCRPQSRLSESGISSTSKSVTSCAKDQLDGQNAISSVETAVQNSIIDGAQQPQVSIPSSSFANISVSPISIVSRETSPTQSYPSFVQSSVPSSSPMISSQMGNIQVQPATCPSPGQSKGSHQINQAAVPSPRPYGMVNQDLGGGIPRMTYPSYPPHPQAPLPNSPYSTSGRSPGFSPAAYPLRSPSMHPPNCMPNRVQFQPQSSSGPTSSMPPPPTLPQSSLPSNQSSVCDNNGPSQSTFAQVPSYPTPVPSTGGGYGPSSSQAHGSHPSWDQEIPYQPPHPGGMFHHQFVNRPPYLGPSTDRGVGGGGYPPPSIPISNASNLIQHNGQHAQPSATGPYPNNQSLSYSNHHGQYPCSQSQMPYPHPQSQYIHPYPHGGPTGGGPPILQQQPQHPQHIVPPPTSSTTASPYPSSILNSNNNINSSASPLSQHMQNSREGFHVHYPHDVQHPAVSSSSSSNENFVTSGGFPPNSGSVGSPGIIRPSSVMNNNGVSKPSLITGGKMGILDPSTRPVNPGCPASIPSSQINVNQAGMTPSELSSVHVPQQYQHRLGSQSNNSQLQQFSGLGNYPPGLGSSSVGSQSGSTLNNVVGSDILQSSTSFQGYQQQYHSPSNSQIPLQQSQNTANNQNSLYSIDGTHSDVGSNQLLNNISSQSLSGFHKLIEMGTESERRPWLEHYIRFMDGIGKPVAGLPQVVKQPLDLYRLYVAVRERGGVAEVIKGRRWKEISQVINISASASAAYALRKNYCKFLLEYECRFDRGGIDPRPLLAHIESLSGKKRKCSSVDSDPNSISSGLAPAPPSPTGSHSSASSSLLPPGSSGASLSGGPSGTAGSAASDSQLGPPSSQQQRFSDQGQPGSVSTVPESPSAMPSMPSPPGLSGQSSTSYLPPSSVPTPNVASPPRPSSCAVISGYPNTSLSSDNNCCPWPWTSENRNSESINYRQPPSASETTTTGQGLILTNRETTSSQYAQSRIGSGNLPSNNNIQPSSGVYVGMPYSTCASGSMANGEPMTQHNFNPYLTQGPPFASNPLHPMLNQHHGPPQTMEHSFTGSQSPLHPRHPSNHNFRTPSFSSVPTPSGVSGESIALFRMHQIRPGAPQMTPYIPGGTTTSLCTSTTTNNSINNNGSLDHAAPMPPHFIHHHHHNQRSGYVTTILKRLDHCAFPPGSVEATPVDSSRRRRYRAKDLGSIAPFKLLMALRSGLTAEVSWALNCLNILLRDENGMDFIIPSALPGLITSLVDLWRHTLGELFDHKLFITSLELPTDLSLISSFSSCTETKQNLMLENTPHPNCSRNANTVNMTCLDVMKSKSYLTDSSNTHNSNYNNSLIRLEHEISRIAASKNVPLSAVRAGLRRLLNKCNDSKSINTPVRFRNGLMLRLENLSNLIPVNSLTTTSTSTTSCNSLHRIIDTNTNSIGSSTSYHRSRKRGKQLSASMYSSSSTPSHFMPTSVSSHVTTNERQHIYTLSNMNISTANLGKSNYSNSGDVSSCGGSKVIWSSPQVTSIVDSLRTPEACSNLRDLALYVIDTLLESSTSNDDNHGSSFKMDSNDVKLGSDDHQLNLMKSSCLMKSSGMLLRQLIEKGGGDTTCHIMPPFGAYAFQSSHWMNNQENNNALYSDNDYLPKLTECSTASSPVSKVVVSGLSSLSRSSSSIKQSVSSSELNNELMIKSNESEDDEDEDSEQSPSNKRIRHSSSSSLPCPTLSPQPVCDISDDIDNNNKLLESNNVTADNCIVTGSICDNDDELEFSQLIDENGRCPLRAREELVHHGSVCLWPNHNETDSYEARAVRCLCVSTVLRNLSFMNTVERQLSKQKGVLALIGRLLLFGHEHVGENDTWQVVEEKAHSLESSFCAWWTPTWLEDMRENAMVLLVNVAGYLELIQFDESIVRPILEGLLHWITCSTSASVDPFPGHRTLSPRRLALEALNRLCVHETNVDLLLSTPSDEKVLSRLFDRLATWLAVPEDQVTRELALSTMHYLAGGGATFSSSSLSSNIGKVTTNETNASSGTYIGTTMLADAKPCPISGLLSFIEAAEATTRRVIDQYGVQALQERPELMGTSLEMVRRAGALLDRLAIDSKGRLAFTPDLELRLMDLVTSRVLDATVAHLLCGALHRLLPDFNQLDNDNVKISTIPPIPTPSAITELLTQSSAVTVVLPETVIGVNQISQESSTIIPSHKYVDKVEVFKKQSQQQSTNIMPTTPTCSDIDHNQQQTVLNNSTDNNNLIIKEADSSLPSNEHFNKPIDNNIDDHDNSVDNKTIPLDNNCVNNTSLIDKHPATTLSDDSLIIESRKQMNGSVVDNGGDNDNVNCCKTETFDFRTNLTVNNCGTANFTTITTTNNINSNKDTTTTVSMNNDTVVDPNIYCNNTDSPQPKVNCVDSS